MEVSKKELSRRASMLAEMVMGSMMLKDYGNMRTFGAIMSNRRHRNKYLRKHRLGKFAKK